MRPKVRLRACVGITLMSLGCSEPSVYLGFDSTGGGCAKAIQVPPANLSLNAFYQKYLDANGIPVVSSANVTDEALGQACVVTAHLTARSDSVRAALIDNHFRVAVIGTGELTLDIPEYSDLPASSSRNWNQERGEGATVIRPVSSVGEENLLCLADDIFAGESILVETLAYAIQDLGISVVDGTFDDRLSATYQAAIAAGLWQNTMAAQNTSFYFAEGVQDWYDANQQADPANGVNNFVNTRDELSSYDATLASLIAEQFVVDDWRPRCP